MTEKFNIIFIGTSDFGLPALSALLQATSYKLQAVVTSPDKPVGRHQVLTPTPIKEWAIKNNIPVLQPEKIKNEAENIKKLNPDLIITAAYGQILPKAILDIPKYGCLNLHASLLPKYRGASPIHAAILNGDTSVGITIILMNEKMDEGPIVAQSTLKNYPPKADQPRAGESRVMNYEKLHKALAELSAELLVKILPDYLGGNIKPVPQNEKEATDPSGQNPAETSTKIIKKEDGKIDWNKSAEEIERMTRAYSTWPGAFTFWNNKRLKIIKTREQENKKIKKETHKIGEVFLTEQNEIAVQCSASALILEKIQLEGKNEISVSDFVKGHPTLIGSCLI